MRGLDHGLEFLDAVTSNQARFLQLILALIALGAVTSGCNDNTLSELQDSELWKQSCFGPINEHDPEGEKVNDWGSPEFRYAAAVLLGLDQVDSLGEDDNETMRNIRAQIAAMCVMADTAYELSQRRCAGNGAGHGIPGGHSTSYPPYGMDVPGGIDQNSSAYGQVSVNCRPDGSPAASFDDWLDDEDGAAFDINLAPNFMEPVTFRVWGFLPGEDPEDWNGPEENIPNGSTPSLLDDGTHANADHYEDDGETYWDPYGNVLSRAPWTNVMWRFDVPTHNNLFEGHTDENGYVVIPVDEEEE